MEHQAPYFLAAAHSSARISLVRRNAGGFTQLIPDHSGVQLIPGVLLETHFIEFQASLAELESSVGKHVHGYADQPVQQLAGGHDVAALRTFDQGRNDLPQIVIRHRLEDYRAKPRHLLSVGVPRASGIALGKAAAVVTFTVSTVW